MRYCIYKGSLVLVKEVSGIVVNFIDDGETGCAPKDDVIEVKDEDFKSVELEFIAVKAEINNIKARMYRLDEEYRKKKEAYREMMSEARSKEIAIINKLLKVSRPKDAGGRFDESLD